MKHVFEKIERKPESRRSCFKLITPDVGNRGGGEVGCLVLDSQGKLVMERTLFKTVQTLLRPCAQAKIVDIRA